MQKSRDARRKTDLKQIQTALELYRSDQGKYPNATSGAVANCGSALQSSCVASATIYMRTVPTDPTYGVYSYVPANCNATGCSAYALTSYLERRVDPDGWGGAGCSAPNGLCYSVYNP